MKVLEKNRLENRLVRQNKSKAISAGPASRKEAQLSCEERQIAEVERTFTDRWEW